MIDLQRAALWAEFAAAIVAVLLARRHAAHRPAAIALVALVLTDVIRIPIHAALYPPPATPYGFGKLRLLFHLSTGFWLANVAVLPMLSMSVCLSRRKGTAIKAVFVVWAVVTMCCALFYPHPRVYGRGLARIFLGAELTGLFVTIVAFVEWARRRERPTTSHVVALLLAGADAVAILAPYSTWRLGFFERYDTAQVVVLGFFGLIAAYEGVVWSTSARSSSS